MHPIRVKRLQKSLSLDALAYRAGINASTLCRIERCQQDPTLSILRQLAHVFCCNEADLIPSKDEEKIIRQTVPVYQKRRMTTKQS